MDLFNELEKKMKNNEDKTDFEAKKDFFKMLKEIIDEIEDEDSECELDDDDDEDDENVLVPIKDTIHNAMDKYGAYYGEYSVMLLRQYYIALLNLGFIELNELKDMVEKFVSKIDSIEYCDIAPTIYGGGVEIEDRIMYISTELSDGVNDDNYDKYSVMIDNGIFDDEVDEFDFDDLDETDNSKFEIEFYKAVTSVIIDSLEAKTKGLAYIISEIISEKVWFMDTKELRIILPQSIDETLGTTTITTRTGYLRCNLPISLFKQFCIAYDINENKVFRKMFHSSFKEVIDDTCNGEMKFFLFVLDEHFHMYSKRVACNEPVNSELNIIESYQSQLNNKFEKINDNYFAFVALITTDDLRATLMEKKAESTD